MKPSRKDEQVRREQELAWIGDTILDLYARMWILRERGTVCGETQRRMTSNQFLACIGNPTAVEAKIGELYQEGGMEVAFAWIEAQLLPIFEKQERKRR